MIKKDFNSIMQTLQIDHERLCKEHLKHVLT